MSRGNRVVLGFVAPLLMIVSGLQSVAAHPGDDCGPNGSPFDLGVFQVGNYHWEGECYEYPLDEDDCDPDDDGEHTQLVTAGGVSYVFLPHSGCGVYMREVELCDECNSALYLLELTLIRARCEAAGDPVLVRFEFKAWGDVMTHGTALWYGLPDEWQGVPLLGPAFWSLGLEMAFTYDVLVGPAWANCRVDWFQFEVIQVVPP